MRETVSQSGKRFPILVSQMGNQKRIWMLGWPSKWDHQKCHQNVKIYHFLVRKWLFLAFGNASNFSKNPIFDDGITKMKDSGPRSFIKIASKNPKTSFVTHVSTKMEDFSKKKKTTSFLNGRNSILTTNGNDLVLLEDSIFWILKVDFLGINFLDSKYFFFVTIQTIRDILELNEFRVVQNGNFRWKS